MTTLIIRADAEPQNGMGHVMRSLALAQAWQEGGRKAMFAMAAGVSGVEARLKAEGMEIVQLSAPPGSCDDATQLVELAQRTGATWVVLDGYHFGSDYQQRIKHAGLRLLCIDDYGHAGHYASDVVLNPNLSATEAWYARRAPATRLLLGNRYALLRREFAKWHGWTRSIPEVGRNVLVTLGGYDPNRVMPKVMDALQHVHVEGLEAVVVASDRVDDGNLQGAMGSSRCAIRLERGSMNMADHMSWADAAVSAGGSTCWELAFMGLSSVMLVLAENQRPIAEGLADAGLAVNLGWHERCSAHQIARGLQQLLSTVETRAAMARRGRALIDGEGADRVVMVLTGQRLRLRQVRAEAARLLWEWANDPAVRTTSFSPDPIPWEDHVRWLAAKLRDPNRCRLFLALNDHDAPVGQVRFDVSDGLEARIDVSVEASQRGAGYGSALINMGVAAVAGLGGVQRISALIKPGNQRSIRAFEKAKFRVCGSAMVNGIRALRYIKLVDNGCGR